MKKIIVFTIILVNCLVFADPPDWQQITGTEYSMVLMAQAQLFEEPFINTGDNMIGAFGPGGETDCRALGTWQSPNPPYDGYWYFTIVGNEIGDIITFKVYDDTTDTIYSCGETIIFENNATIGSIQNPFQLIIQDSFIAGVITLLTQTPPAGNIENVIVSAGGISVNPAANGYYEIPLNTGSYDVIASLAGYTTVTLSDLTLQGNQGIGDANITLIDWLQITGTQYSMVVMAIAEIADNPINGGVGNILAAFGDGGSDDCRGVAIWEAPSLPYWDGYWYFNIVGNIIGESINFKIFDIETETIYDCYQNITFDNNATIGSPSDPYIISDGGSQQMDLVENWNWISFNIHPQNTAVNSVFAELGDTVFQIKSQTQSATYYPPNWIGGLTNIQDGKTYLVDMSDPYSGFSISGIPIPADTPIDLTSGWNWVAYLPQNNMLVENALTSIEDNVFQIKSQTESATYYDPPGSWVGNLTVMQPDVGYKIDMNNSDQLIYQPSDIIRTASIKDFHRDPPLWEVISGTEFSMVVMATITFDDNYFTNLGENMVGAFGPDGEDDCRSIGSWQNIEDGFWYFTIVGNTIGDEIIFKIYDENTDTIFDCNEILEFENNITIGNPNELFSITCSSINSDAILPTNDLKIDIFPNPFNPSTTISFRLNTENAKDTKIEIYNLKGQKIKKFEISPESLRGNLGINKVIWNGTDNNNKPVTSGIYFVKLSNGKNSVSIKVLMLK